MSGRYLLTAYCSLFAVLYIVWFLVLLQYCIGLHVCLTLFAASVRNKNAQYWLLESDVNGSLAHITLFALLMLPIPTEMKVQ